MVVGAGVEKQKYVYRYTGNGEEIFSAGKRHMPDMFVDKILRAKAWLPKPSLPLYREYFSDIACETYPYPSKSLIVYKDIFQIVTTV